MWKNGWFFKKRKKKERKKKEKWRHGSSNNILQLSCLLAVSFPPVIKFMERKRRVSPFFGGSVAAGLVTCRHTHKETQQQKTTACITHHAQSVFLFRKYLRIDWNWVLLSFGLFIHYHYFTLLPFLQTFRLSMASCKCLLPISSYIYIENYDFF